MTLRTGLVRNRRTVAGIAALAFTLGLTSVSEADVTRIVTTRVESPTFGGASFGEVGQYEKLVGRAFGEVDPHDPRNAVIVDLALAPRNVRGMVEYSTDIYILKPVDSARGNHRLFFELGAGGVLVTIERCWTHRPGTVRAQTTVKHQHRVLARANVQIQFRPLETAEPIPQELEHVIERLDGVDLAPLTATVDPNPAAREIERTQHVSVRDVRTSRTHFVSRMSDPREGRPSIAVTAYNHAAVAADVFGAAKSTLDRIFAAAGVALVWVDSAAETPPDRVRLVVRRRAEDPALRTMGQAIVERNSCGGIAFVFYAVVLDQARRAERDVSAVLGYAMAHELGHLLLPAPAHTHRGVMRPEWDGDDLRHVGDGSLAFSPEQSRAIASTVSMRGCTPENR